MAGGPDRDDGTAEPADLSALLEHLRATRGFDFTGYKRSSLERRIARRIAAVGAEGYGDYQDYLEVNPDEFTELFNTILINVTGFFRDRAAWDFLASDVVPKLLESVPESDTIRVWSAACASGEEPYSIAMVLAEALGHEAFKQRVKIYATDVDDDALTTARQAAYSPDALKDVPEGLVDKYFDAESTRLLFKPDLRRSVIFGRNDLVQDAPISRVDLLVSRNTLMYFTPETQASILGHFNFSLKDSGFLFVGKSEMLITHGDLFTPHKLKWRVFRKVPRPAMRDRLTFMGEPRATHGGDDQNAGRYAQVRDGAADLAPVAQIAVDGEGFVVGINQAARTLFSLGADDVGRPVQDLEVSYRPVELRAGIQRAYEERRPVDLGRVELIPRAGEPSRVLQVTVTPLVAGAEAMLGASIAFQDVTALARLDVERRDSQRQLETAYEELESTVEELETTNEELQSTNEELETTNEELQSTNEELETMNEELHSTNDELEVMNVEHGTRASEMDRLNLFLEGILGSLHLAVAVLDSSQQVQLWNVSATDMWGPREEEVTGEHFLSLDIGLPVDRLRDAIRAAMSDGGAPTEMAVEAVNRRGRNFECSIRVLPLLGSNAESHGAILIMSDGPVQTPAE
jgi:two-component system CheB/CheR fusion protein